MSTVEAMTTVDAAEVPTCHRGLDNLDEEHSYWIDEVEGEVPLDLEGTFYRNGPGRQRIGGQPYGHWFDGDGMLCAFSIRDGRVHFKNTYVKTKKYMEETEAHAIRYRGFGTQIPGGVRKNFLRIPGNPANTSVVHHGGKLLTLWEGGHPWELAADTLDTVGECSYDGRLRWGNVFSAHGKIHPRTGDLVNFGAGMAGIGRSGPQACMNIYRVNRAGRLYDKGRIPLATFPFAHDFALTDRYAVFFVNSIVSTAMGHVIIGRTSISEQTKFDENIPMRVIVVDLDTMAEVRSFETDPGAIIHFGNAYEDGDEIVVDGMYASDFEANNTLSDVFNSTKFPGGTFQRYRLNLLTGAMSESPMSEHESEFPVFNRRIGGQRHHATYTICSIDNGANSFYNGFQKVTGDGDTTLVTLPPGRFASEPMYAPAKGSVVEDDGYVLMVVYDAVDHRSELQIFRAPDVTERVARLRLSHHVPHQFHGFFHDDVLLTEALTA